MTDEKEITYDEEALALKTAADEGRHGGDGTKDGEE